MSRVVEIKRAIESLGKDDYAELRQWFTERDWARWDRQIEKDYEAGRLDFLIKEVREEKRGGRLGKL